VTAINVVCQHAHKCIHIVTDAAVYDTNGIVHSFGPKLFPVPHWPGAVGVRGTAIAVPLLGHELSHRFCSFDALVAGIEGALPEMVDHWGLPNAIELIIAGWSTERNQPESYVIETTDDLPVALTADEAETAEYLPKAFKLMRLPDAMIGPLVTDVDLYITASYEGVNLGEDPGLAVWNLQKVLEIQRHALWSDGIHWIGGFGQLTTITPNGISHRVLQRWPDKLGELITPNPVDWTAFNNTKPKIVN
jgi:hypothetical protein